MSDETRRPVGSRNTRWAHVVARRLASMGLRPNTISLLSVVFAACAGACLAATLHVDGLAARMALFVAAACGIQLRLLCNLFDGMVAVEHGKKSRSGEIFNELPDRFADICIFCGAGYAMQSGSWSIQFGWAAATLAVLTAYVRTLGASAGAGQHFVGPMAKQHRMAVMTVACLASFGTTLMQVSVPLLDWGLWLVIVGCLITIARRSVRIVQTLEAT